MTREAGNRSAEEQDRESARMSASQLTAEPTSVVHLAVRKVVYDVPGRRRNGTPVSSGAARAMRTMLMTPLVLIYVPIALVLSVLAEVGIQLHPRAAGRVVVHGKPNCGGLLFADAVRGAGRGVWLAWSKSQVALVSMSDHGPQVVWRSSSENRPRIKMKKTTIRWPDGSRVEFDISSDELKRVVEQNGTP